MKGFFMGVALILSAIAQVTVAPLFPVAGAVPEFVVLALGLLVAFSSPKPVMIGTPIAALAYGFLSDRAPALLLLGYLPLLPLGYLLDESRAPVNHYLRTVAMITVTGLWLRTLLSLGAMTAGADAAFGVLIADVLVPGFFLDLALLTVVYIPFRLIGWTGQGMTLGRTGYYARL